MRLRDYKTLLETDRHAAMLFDLTERHPRGPEAKLRARDYVPHTSYYGNAGAILTLKSDSIPATAEGSDATGGWNPREIYELSSSEWHMQSYLENIEVPEGAGGMGRDYYCEDGMCKLFKRGAQLTRRARRAARRVGQAQRWVKENITQALYEVSYGYGTENVFVHGECEEGATTQFGMFLQPAVSGVPGFNADRITVGYKRPATEPTALMTLNDKFVKEMDSGVATRKSKIEQMLKEIEGMEAARELVYSYSVNMAATFGTDEEDEEDAA
jgi:hypothetical protein